MGPTMSAADPSSASRRRWSRALVAAISIAVVALLYVLAIRTGSGQDVDELARESRKLTSLPIRRGGVLVLRVCTVTVFPAVFLVSLVRLVATGRRRTAAGCAVAAVAAVVTAELLKAELPRPPLGRVDLIDHLATFPSGHATYAMVVALTALIAVGGRHRLVPGLAGGVALVALVITGSGWHRASDVTAGFLVASATFAVVAIIAPPEPPAPDRVGSGPSITSARSRAVTAVLSAAVLVAFYLPVEPGPAALELSASLYVAASLATIAVGVLTIVVHAVRIGPASAVAKVSTKN